MSAFEPFDQTDEAPETVALASRLLAASIVNPVLDIVGDQWVLKILRELHFAPGRFDRLKSALGISRGTLATRLDDLVHHGLVERIPYQVSPQRFEYRLSEMGVDTAPIIHTISRWDRTWGAPDRETRQLTHAACGQAFQPFLACGHCRSLIRARDIAYEPGPGVVSFGASLARRARRKSATDERDPSISAADILGDRWAALVLASAWFGLRRFSDIERAIRIAPNILTRRLNQLTACGIFARHLYQQRPARAKYILTEKGFDLYPMTVALLHWGDKWIADRDGPPLLLTHKTCGARLAPTLFCESCGQPADSGELRLDGASAA
jgi:DNA-binding HxlR family transcriptional regulator